MNMTENKIVANNGSSIVLYTTDDGNTQLEVKLEKDTVWLTQSQMAELFGRDRTVITRHIRNIFKEGELDENITCAKFAHMGTDQDQTYETKMYSLDVIISVGYRVKSINGTKFRIWVRPIVWLDGIRISGDSRRWHSLLLSSSTQSPPQRNMADMADITSSHW